MSWLDLSRRESAARLVFGGAIAAPQRRRGLWRRLVNRLFRRMK